MNEIPKRIFVRVSLWTQNTWGIELSINAERMSDDDVEYVLASRLEELEEIERDEGQLLGE